MTVSLQRIIELRGLGLSLQTSAAGLDRRVRWAHVSELADPTPWLEGEEFLLSTGMQLFGSPKACVDYCSRMARVGVSALGLSVGYPLTHATIPPALITAAEAAGLPLVLIPTATPLEAIVKGVADLLEQERNARLRRAFEAQRALTASAVNPGGLRGVLDNLVSATGLWAAVCDPSGHPVAWSPADVPGRLQDLAPMIRLARQGGMNASVSAGERDRQEMVLPLGVRPHLRGLLVAGKDDRIDPFDRSLVVSAVWLLTLELERRFDAGAAIRRRRAQLLEWLLRGQPSQPEVEARLRQVGLPVTDAAVVLIDPEAPRGYAAPQDSAADTVVTADSIVQDLHRSDAVAAYERDGLICALVFDPPADLKSRLASLIGRGRAGIGAPMPPGTASLSCRQARRALAVAQRRPQSVVTLGELGAFRAILQLAESSTLAGFADSALGAIDLYDAVAREPVLRSTLREYLMGTGGAAGAAETLGVHRHTIRERLRLIQRLCDRDLADPHDRFELLLAMEIRDLICPELRVEPSDADWSAATVHSVYSNGSNVR